MSGGAGAPFMGMRPGAPERGAGAPSFGDATAEARIGPRIRIGALRPAPGSHLRPWRRHCSAVRGLGRWASDSVIFDFAKTVAEEAA